MQGTPFDWPGVARNPKINPGPFQVVFVGRNVKDAALSFYYHMKLSGFRRGFPEFASLFRRDLVIFNPLIPLVLEGFELRDRPNVFFTTYEEMSRDLKPVAQRLIKFLGKGIARDRPGIEQVKARS